MKILQINATCGNGSTGRICQNISEVLFDNGIDNCIAYSIGESDYPYSYKFADNKTIKKYSLIDHLNGEFGFVAKCSTKKLISFIDHYQPNIIHIHNIHSHDIDVYMLFSYLKKLNIKIYWTFHDCWAFTGYCMYFDMVKCSAWKTLCKNCPQRNRYSFFGDKSSLLYLKKKKILHDIDLTIITPSEWLAKLTKESFLGNNTIKIINNGINLSIFHPVVSDFKEKYFLNKKKIILGIADFWDQRKGIDVFIEISKSLSKDYQIVLVGTNDKIDKYLPKNILSIHRTMNQRELVEIYSAADVVVNPTREDNYPTVNMESIACGTPVITFRTGGSPEMITQNTGWVVEQNDILAILKILDNLQCKSEMTVKKCVESAKQFDMRIAFYKYLNLYIENDLGHLRGKNEEQ